STYQALRSPQIFRYNSGTWSSEIFGGPWSADLGPPKLTADHGPPKFSAGHGPSKFSADQGPRTLSYLQLIGSHHYIPEMAAAQEDDWNLNIDSAVGIDLGTTYSCVSVYKDGRITVIPDENGNKLIPSVVAFESNSRGEIERLVGRDATENEGIDQSHIVTEVKRLIGRKFDEPAVHENIKRWPFQVTASSEGNAQILLDFDGQQQVQYSPEYISYIILKKLKEMATNYLGKVKERRRILVMDVGGGTSDVALIRVAGEKFTVLACEGDNNVGGEDFDTN
ncbi:hypothetical protein B566_EDAN012704, partial [Ephemera danica]